MLAVASRMKSGWITAIDPPSTMKIITAAQAGALIPDNATIFLGGLAVSSLPEEVLKGVEKNFLETGHPRNVTTWACGAIGNSKDAGMVHVGFITHGKGKNGSNPD